MVNGQCSMVNAQKCDLARAEGKLVCTMPSVSILGEANGQ